MELVAVKSVISFNYNESYLNIIYDKLSFSVNKY